MKRFSSEPMLDGVKATLNDKVVDVGALASDWSTFYTAEQIEEEMPGIKFKGIGWYLNKGTSANGTEYNDSVLVLPTRTMSADGKQVFRVMTWNYQEDVIDSFKWVAGAPQFIVGE